MPAMTLDLDEAALFLRVAELGVDCLRINPGNIGREDRVRAVVDAARDRGIPIRIGVNAGSLEKDLQKKYGEPTPEALVESALRHVEHLERLNFQDFKVSVKASDVFLAVAAVEIGVLCLCFCQLRWWLVFLAPVAEPRVTDGLGCGRDFCFWRPLLVLQQQQSLCVAILMLMSEVIIYFCCR